MRSFDVNDLISRLKLQSPFWQGIGVIVSIIALLVSTFVAYDIYQKSLQSPDLTIMRRSSFNPIGFGERSSKPITMSIGGEVVSDLEVYYYTLENTGNLPIKPIDYVEPITGQCEVLYQAWIKKKRTFQSQKWSECRKLAE
jgi:hypothetical protein